MSTTCVRTAAGEFDAQQLRALLEANDIPCEFHGEALRNTHGFTVDGLGCVEIHVPDEYVARARELFERVERGELELEADADIASADE